MNKKNLRNFSCLNGCSYAGNSTYFNSSSEKNNRTDMGDYTEYVGTLGGANFVVRIPDEWNAMLVGWLVGLKFNAKKR